nr:unnamed protein product [Callosobruchus chinensis]
MFVLLLELLCTIAACYGHTHKYEADTSVDAAGSSLQAYTVLLSLNDFETVYCSGVLLNEYWVLTLATCLKRGALSEITVHKETQLSGGNITYTGKRFSHVKRAFIHQQFGIPMPTYNDLALLRLDEGLMIGENQTRVVLPTQVEDIEAKFKDRPLHMTRYCSFHNTIEFKDIFPQDRSLCSYPYNKVSFDKVFCALFQEERKTKFKDSNDMGGPVVSSFHIIEKLDLVEV